MYRDARAFFAATYLTGGLRRLLTDVLRGLAEGKGDRVLQLRSPFGGGKSHTLAALYHAAHHPERTDLTGFGKPVRSVRVAVFDGEKFDVQGRVMDGRPVQTMWGMLAAQLGCYDVVAHHDATRGAPGGDVIAQMLGDQPTLLLLDEVLKYLERASAEPVLDSTLGRQVQDFLQSLSVEVARAPRAVMVYSLQASVREAMGNQASLDMLDHLTSRVDAKREPVTGDEILPVLRRRLLDQDPDPAAATAAATAFATAITRARASHALDEASRRAAEDDRLALHRRIEAAYPFHPALIDIMTERWASLPDFQRTRGALRFLSVCLYTLKRDNQARALLGPGDIPIAILLETIRPESLGPAPNTVLALDRIPAAFGLKGTVRPPASRLEGHLFVLRTTERSEPGNNSPAETAFLFDAGEQADHWIYRGVARWNGADGTWIPQTMR